MLLFQIILFRFFSVSMVDLEQIALSFSLHLDMLVYIQEHFLYICVTPEYS